MSSFGVLARCTLTRGNLEARESSRRDPCSPLRSTGESVAAQQGVERLAVIVVHHEVGSKQSRTRTTFGCSKRASVLASSRSRLKPHSKPSRSSRFRVDLRAVAHRDLVRRVLLHGDLDAKPAYSQGGCADAADTEHPRHAVRVEVWRR